MIRNYIVQIISDDAKFHNSRKQWEVNTQHEAEEIVKKFSTEKDTYVIYAVLKAKIKDHNICTV